MRKHEHGARATDRQMCAAKYDSTQTSNEWQFNATNKTRTHNRNRCKMKVHGSTREKWACHMRPTNVSGKIWQHTNMQWMTMQCNTQKCTYICNERKIDINEATGQSMMMARTTNNNVRATQMHAKHWHPETSNILILTTSNTKLKQTTVRKCLYITRE